MTLPYGMLAQISFLKAEDYLNYCWVQNATKFLTPYWKARGQNYTEVESTRDKAATSATVIQDGIRMEKKESLISL